MYVVILAGGSGKRLWPISNQALSKPFLKIDNDLSLLQNTIIRARKLCDLKKIIIVANHAYIKNVIEDCKKLSLFSEVEVIVEHHPKNTTAAIAAAAIYIECHYGSNRNILVLPCDHIIDNEDIFCEKISQLLAKDQKKLCLFGINPTENNTNYGYIKYQDEMVVSFTEKPSKLDADNWVKSGDYLWNSGIIYAKIAVLLKEIKKHSFKTWMLSIRAIHNSTISYEFGYKQITLCKESTINISGQSIDYEILQKSDNLKVIKFNVGWKEIGDLESFCNSASSDMYDNNIYGNAETYLTSNCYIQSKEKHIIVAGVNNLLVIETEDKIFVVDKNSAPNFLLESVK